MIDSENMLSGAYEKMEDKIMGMTMTQKILAAHAGLESVTAGQLIEVNLDLVLGNDITTPVAIREMDKIEKKEVFHKDKIALVMDHFKLQVCARLCMQTRDYQLF